jgi:hypothetical protein
MIEVARTLRLSPPNIGSGAAGIALHRIYLRVRDRYSSEEFREALETLMKDRQIVLVAHVSEIWRDAAGNPIVRRVRPFSRLERIFDLPTDFKAWKPKWYLDSSGCEVNPVTAPHHVEYSQILFYVRSDGLPHSVSRFAEGSPDRESEKVAS